MASLSKTTARIFSTNFKLLTSPRKLIQQKYQTARNLGNVSLGDGKLRVGLIGAPLKLGQPHEGVSQAPQLIRESCLAEMAKNLGHDLQDYGDIECPLPQNTTDKPSRIGHVIEFNKQLSCLVQRVLRHNRLCVTIGGDHAIGMGTVQGFTSAFEESCLLWIDAHADINTLANSGSGNMHGMPVSFNIPELFEENGVDSLDMAGLKSWFTPKLNPVKMAYIGLRAVDPEEKLLLEKLNIPTYTMQEVDDLGIREVTRRAIEQINPEKTLPLHVSLDIDVLDPNEAPATGTRVPGGLTLREALKCIEDIKDSGCLKALDLVEVNPDLADNAGAQKTKDAAIGLILAALGQHRGVLYSSL